MAHQVFLSYASEDIESARLLCRVLEAEEGIRCWMAPRDIPAGTDFAAAIVDAIKSAELVLLVFSASTNTSPYVLREVERAVGYDRPVISVRLDNAAPNPSLEYYLNMLQWLDAPRGVESRRKEILEAIRIQLGTPFVDARSSAQSGAGRPSGERRLATILRTEVPGMAGLTESGDPEETQELLNRCLDRIVPCIERYGGAVDKFTGSGMMALFGAPVAHDNDAERAIRAALDIREAVADFGSEFRMPLAVHQGVSTGRVLAGRVGGRDRRGYSVVGDAVDVAGRLEELSAPNEILIGPETCALTRSLVHTEDAGTVSLRGRVETIQTHRVLGAMRTGHTETPRHLDATLIGRESELRVLCEALNRLSVGEGGVIHIAGDAGMGKTRLLEEGHRRAGTVAWLAGHATAMGSNAVYQPVKQMLEADVGWIPNDDREQRREKLTQRVASLLPDDCHKILRFLGALLGVETAEDAEWLAALEETVLRRRLHAAVGQYVAQLAIRQPLVLVFEDLHWADNATAALIEELTPLVHEVPLLLCLISRPDLGSSAFRPEKINPRAKERFYWLRLGRLSRKQSRELVARLLRSTNLPPGLDQLVEARAEGNPFFIQEVLRSLIESGCIRDQGRGEWQVIGRSGLAVPDTLQGIIASRVDRLLPNAKNMIRLASVFGRSFSPSLLSSVADSPEDSTARELSYLEDVEMVRATAKGPEPQFTFTHALIQQAVYDTIPVRECRLLHERVAQAIESLPAPAEDTCDLLAYHYGRAERWDRAQYYLFKAGEQAGALVGVRDASEYYRQAFEALLRGWSPSRDHGSGGDLDWFLAAWLPLHDQQRLALILEPLEEFFARVTEAVGPSDHRTLAVAEVLGCAYGEKSMWPEAIALLESTLKRREAAGDPDDPSIIRLLGQLAACLVPTPRREEAEALLIRGIKLHLASATPDRNTLGRLYTALSYYYASKGELLRVKTLLEDALTNPLLEMALYPGVLFNLCDCEVRLGLAAEAERHGRLACQTGAPYLRAFGRANLGFALQTFGRYREAQAEYEQALEIFDEVAREWESAWALAGIAECQLRAGELDAAAETAGRAANSSERAGETGYPGTTLSEALGTLAGVELARGNLQEAERLLADAALSVPTGLDGGDALVEAELLFRRAQLRLKQGRRNDGEREAARAAELLAGLGGENHPRRQAMLAEWQLLTANS